MSWLAHALRGLLLRPGYRRVDGVEAASWRHSVFTRDRTDLPYPPPRQDSSWEQFVLRHGLRRR